jgi:Uma2 family endonuclease
VVPAGDYGARHPDSALLVIEVASSSLRDDLERKARLYARAQVEEYWVIDVAAGSVTVHLGRAEGRWTSVAAFGRESVLAPRLLPQVQVTLADLLRKR